MSEVKICITYESLQKEKPDLLGFWLHIPSLEEALAFCDHYTRSHGLSWVQTENMWTATYENCSLKTTLWIEDNKNES